MNFQYLFRRCCLIVLTVLTASFVTFLLLELTPGDPAEVIIQKVFVGSEDYRGGAAEKEIIARRLGFDRPLLSQYVQWLSGAMVGNFGVSYRTNENVGKELAMRIKPTLLLGCWAMVLTLVITTIVAVTSSLTRWAPVHWLLNSMVVAGIAVPNFYLGIIFILLFSIHFDLLPVSGYGTPYHFILPVCTLACTISCSTVTIFRDAIVEIQSQMYMITARAKGLSHFQIFRAHVFRNALIPVLPFAALQMGYLFGGVVVVESLFSWPGIGSYLLEAITVRDIPVVLAAICFISLAYTICNFIADVLLCLLDPRVRFT